MLQKALSKPYKINQIKQKTKTVKAPAKWHFTNDLRAAKNIIDKSLELILFQSLRLSAQIYGKGLKTKDKTF